MTDFAGEYSEGMDQITEGPHEMGLTKYEWREKDNGASIFLEFTERAPTNRRVSGWFNLFNNMAIEENPGRKQHNDIVLQTFGGLWRAAGIVSKDDFPKPNKEAFEAKLEELNGNLIATVKVIPDTKGVKQDDGTWKRELTGYMTFKTVYPIKK
ncbi:hypothetical protein LCGC14_2543060 [marine sediment metagenome]|uniref:Uncharacterized protein n=1 Tax=marine sediment metagenome TaxID=412755 RepID=A0A0F9AQ77_9ZZZZ